MIGLALIFVAAAASGTLGQPSVGSQYGRCLAQVSLNADAALEAALAWRGDGGGAPAEHCVAVALVALGHFDEGATRLEKLSAAQGPHGNAVRAELLLQAGNAFLLAGRAERAVASLSSGIRLAEDANLSAVIFADLHYDRARAHLAAGETSSALADLTTSISSAQSIAALSLRARLFRQDRNFAAAAGDIRAALALDPDSLEALLERGHLRAAQSDAAGAREDFVTVAARAGETPLAEEARHGLEALEFAGER